MKPKRKKRRSYDRKQQVETTKKLYGPDWYKTIGGEAATFRKDPTLARRAALKRWHPEIFDDQGNLIGKVLDVDHDSK